MLFRPIPCGETDDLLANAAINCRHSDKGKQKYITNEYITLASCRRRRQANEPITVQ